INASKTQASLPKARLPGHNHAPLWLLRQTPAGRRQLEQVAAEERQHHPAWLRLQMAEATCPDPQA
ncbi:hypothetical protein, partial [Sansalvadorimonas verongulae]|uniref:hypothetical protein n=1 Tax=Sansalvadorimonas verongulae TaxID=2172824 RepID=UPI001E2D6B80